MQYHSLSWHKSICVPINVSYYDSEGSQCIDLQGHYISKHAAAAIIVAVYELYDSFLSLSVQVDFLYPHRKLAAAWANDFRSAQKGPAGKKEEDTDWEDLVEQVVHMDCYRVVLEGMLRVKYPPVEEVLDLVETYCLVSKQTAALVYKFDNFDPYISDND